MTVPYYGIELETVFGGFCPVYVLFFCDYFGKDWFDLVCVELGDCGKSGFCGQFVHESLCAVRGLWGKGTCGLDVENDRK